jgi:hypothetical protein
VYLVTLAQTRSIEYISVWTNPAIIANDNITLDIGEWLDSYVLAYFGIRMNVS